MTKQKLKELFDKQYNTLGSSVKKKFCEKILSYNTIYHPPLDEDAFISGTIFNTANIRYGYFLEEVINYFLEENGALITTEKKNGNYDLLFEKNDILYVGEIKMRDNHDSTKKRGQILNLEEKTNIQKEKNPNKKVVALIYFVDPYEKKNGKYYLTELDNCVLKNIFDDAKLFYGDEIFKEFNLYNEWIKIKILIEEQNIEFKKNNYLKQIIYEYIKEMSDDNNKLIMEGIFKKEC